MSAKTTHSMPKLPIPRRDFLVAHIEQSCQVYNDGLSCVGSRFLLQASSCDLYRAITHRHVLAADEMEAIIVPVHAIVNAKTVGFHKRVLNHTNGMVGAVVEENVAQI